jgi:hypothetical protein
MLKTLRAAVVAAALLVAAPAVNATQILVGQCIEFDTCWTDGADWSDTLDLAELTALGLGASVPLIAAQTSEFIIRLGVTTMTFDTPGGPVVQMLGEFSGGSHFDPCNLCEIDTVGFFTIPVDATGAVISGHFGNSAAGTSSGVNVCLGEDRRGPCTLAAPEPGSLALAGLALAGLAATGRRRQRR